MRDAQFVQLLVAHQTRRFTGRATPHVVRQCLKMQAVAALRLNQR